jgi:hypothetical protein
MVGVRDGHISTTTIYIIRGPDEAASGKSEKYLK